MTGTIPTAYMMVALLGVLVSSSISVMVARWTVRSTLSMNRAQSTVKAMSDAELSSRHQDLVHSMAVINATPDGVLTLLDQDSDVANEHRQNVIALLNHYEIICVGINSGTLDEDVAKAYWNTILCRRWEQAEPFIMAWRSGKFGGAANPTFCENLEDVVSRWRPRKKRLMFWR